MPTAILGSVEEKTIKSESQKSIYVLAEYRVLTAFMSKGKGDLQVETQAGRGEMRLHSSFNQALKRRSTSLAALSPIPKGQFGFGGTTSTMISR